MPLLGDRSEIRSRTPLPVQDVTFSTTTFQVTNEAVTFGDGAAGTTQRIKLTYDSVMSLYGERIGVDGDSSLAFTTGTVLTTEVPWRFKNTEGKDNETDRLASLANGEFMVDYDNGFILGKNATTTSSSTDTVSYKVRLQATEIVETVTGNDLVSSDNADAYSVSQSSQLESSRLVKASSGNLYKGSVRLDETLTSGTYYLQLINSASVPADGVVTFLMAPIKVEHTLGTDTYIDVDATLGGVPASTGIVWCLSTTEFTKSEGADLASATFLYR